MATEKRDYRIDGIKFLLICLVIIGHYIEPSRYKNDLSTTCYSLIYMLHMPLFVMISGYFCGNHSLGKVKKFSTKMFEVIFTVMLMTILFIKPLKSSFLIVDTPLWFLLCLVYWKIYSFLLDKMKVNLGYQVIVSFIIGIIGFVFLNYNNEFLAAGRGLQFLPYFSIGRWLRSNKLSFNKLSTFILIGAMILTCVLLSGRSLHVFEFQREGLFTLSSQIKMSVGLCFILKLVLWLFTSLASVMIISLAKMPSIFEKYGKYTLAIFCFHCYSYPFVVEYTRNLNIEILLAVVSIIVFTFIARQDIVSKLITNPLSLIINMKKYIH